MNFVDTFQALEACLAKHLNIFMMTKEFTNKLFNVNIVEERTYLIQELRRISSNATIIEHCDRISKKFADSPRYCGLREVTRNPVFELAREKLAFYKVELMNTHNYFELLLNRLRPPVQVSESSLKISHEEATNVSEPKDENSPVVGGLLGPLVAPKLVRYRNSFAKKRSTRNNENPSKLLDYVAQQPQERDELKKYLKSNLTEPPAKHRMGHVETSAWWEDAEEKIEASTQTVYYEEKWKYANSSVFPDNIEQIQQWYSKALSLFCIIEKSHEDSNIPEELIEKADIFLNNEMFDRESFDKMQNLVENTSMKERQEFRILFYRVNCLQKILENMKGLKLEELNEVIFWRDQYRLTASKTSVVRRSNLDRKHKQGNDTSHFNNWLSTLEDDPLRSPSSPSKGKPDTELENVLNSDEEEFENFMTMINNILSSNINEVDQIDNNTSSKPLEKEIKIENEDYDDLVNSVRKDLLSSAIFPQFQQISDEPTNRYSDISRAEAKHWNSPRFKSEVPNFSHQLDENDSKLHDFPRFNTFEPIYNSEDSYERTNEKQMDLANRILEEYDFSQGTYNPHPDELVLRVPRSANIDSGHSDVFRFLPPPTYGEVTQGVGFKYHDRDSDMSEESGIWTMDSHEFKHNN